MIRSVYEKAYRKAAEVAQAANLVEYAKCFRELMTTITDEKEKHQKRAAERGEKIEQPQILRATKGYTDLLTKAYTEGSLGDIVAAVLPCTKLYNFIGHAIKKAIPDHHHTYSEWIDTYATDGMVDSTRLLENMLDALSATEDKASNEFYYSEVNNVRLWRDLKKIEKTRQAGRPDRLTSSLLLRKLSTPSELLMGWLSIQSNKTASFLISSPI